MYTGRLALRGKDRRTKTLVSSSQHNKFKASLCCIRLFKKKKKKTKKVLSEYRVFFFYFPFALTVRMESKVSHTLTNTTEQYFLKVGGFPHFNLKSWVIENTQLTSKPLE